MQAVFGIKPQRKIVETREQQSEKRTRKIKMITVLKQQKRQKTWKHCGKTIKS